ncbi:hypothetical protein [Candidatus Nitrotoga sp. 1052]|nr:hypothetical protein [Candidatus Nitrotoga sp. 1052]
MSRFIGLKVELRKKIQSIEEPELGLAAFIKYRPESLKAMDF